MKKTTIGGQALIEGIIMHGPFKSCTVVRKADGTLDINTKDRKKINTIYNKIPILRGVLALIHSLSEGTKALTYSAKISGFEDEASESKFEKWLVSKFGDKKVESFIITFSVMLACVLSVGLFILLPTLIAGVFNITNSILSNLIEGVVRIVIFFVYMYIISKSKDIKRTFMYHGAEHKTITCYEKGLNLTIENVAKMEKEHPRCGTSFLFVVMIISILVFSVFTWQNPLLRILLRIILVPIVVGISYEFNKIIGKYDNLFTNILRYPGIKLQKLTTIEPDESMIEIAIIALENVIPDEDGSDAW